MMAWRFGLSLALLACCSWLGQGCVSYGSAGDGGDADGDDAVDGGDGSDGGDDWPDSGPGDWPHGDDGDPGSDDCAVPAPLRVGLQIGEDPWDDPIASGEVAGPAQVVLARAGAGGFDFEAWLFFPEAGALVKVFAALPDGYGLPLRAGQEVWARATVDMPWWVSYDLEVRRGTADGALVLHLHDGDFMGGELDGCRPAEDAMGCGTVVHPWLVYASDTSPAGVWLRQGSRGVLAEGRRLIKVFIGAFERYVEVWCTDLPGSWLAAAVLNNTLTSQCACRDHADCAQGFLCDHTVARCALDRCAAGGPSCGAGELCDPYHGECVGALGLACETAADCGPGQVCNPEIGVCRDDICGLIDCAPCSPLLGGCYECLHDCDCPAGVCDPQSRSCGPGCVGAKLDFGRANQPAYDLFVACLDARMPQPELFMAAHTEIQLCPALSSFAVCEQETQWSCIGNLRHEPGSGPAVAWEQWLELCALSRLPAVSRIGGAHLVQR